MPQDSGEAIVVGAVGSAAPWFLTGWAEGVELRPCGRRLVSAGSSLLTVRGEIDMNIDIPGLSCNMILVLASIGSNGLLGTEALQSCLPDQLDLRTGQLWAEGRSTLQ